MPYLDLGAKETGGLDLGAQESASTLALTVSSSDTISLSDAAVNNFGSIYSYLDELNLQDELYVLVENGAGSLEWGILIGDIISLGDALLTFAPYVTEVSDSSSLSDDHSRLFNRLQLVSDTLSLLDNALKNSELGDSFTLSDAAAVNLAALANVDYNFGFSDLLEFSDSNTLLGTPDILTIRDGLLLTDRVLVRVNSRLNDYLRRYLNDVPTPLS